MAAQITDDLSKGKLVELPRELMAEILDQLNLSDIRHLNEIYDFDYSLLDYTRLTKPLPAEEGFKNRTNYERYQRRYQRDDPRPQDRLLALKYSQPELLMDFVRQRFLLLTTALTTLIIRGQDNYLRSLTSEDLLPYVPVSQYEPFPVLVLLGILYLTWGTYGQIEAFFAQYHPEDFRRDYLKSWSYLEDQEDEKEMTTFDFWLENYFPHYEELPLFPYACTYEEYHRILNNPRIPDLFRDRINLDHSTEEVREEIAPNLLYLGRDEKLFNYLATYDNHDLWDGYGEILSVFWVNPPLLGFTIFRLMMTYPQHPSWNIESRHILVRPFENKKLLMSLLHKYESHLRSPAIDYVEDVMNNFIPIMSRAVNDNQEELFSELWDLMVSLDPHQETHEASHDYFSSYAQLVDHCLSVDNSYFIDQCRRRLPEIKTIFFNLNEYSTETENLFAPRKTEKLEQIEELSTESLRKYLFIYHRFIAFGRVNKILGINILDDPRKEYIDIFKGLHFATLCSLLEENLLEKNLLELTPKRWQALVDHHHLMGGPIVYGEADLIYEFPDLTIITDQSTLGISDVLKVIKDQLGDRINLAEMFFEDDLSPTRPLQKLMRYDGPDIFNTLFYVYTDDLLAHPQFKHLVSLELGLELELYSDLELIPPKALKRARFRALEQAETEIVKFYMSLLTEPPEAANEYGQFLNVFKFLLDRLKHLDSEEHRNYLHKMFQQVTGRSYIVGEPLTNRDDFYGYRYNYAKIALLDYLAEQMDILN